MIINPSSKESSGGDWFLFYFCCGLLSLNTWDNHRVCEQSLRLNKKLFTPSLIVTILLLDWTSPIQDIAMQNKARGIDSVYVRWCPVQVSRVRVRLELGNPASRLLIVECWFSLYIIESKQLAVVLTKNYDVHNINRFWVPGDIECYA